MCGGSAAAKIVVVPIRRTGAREEAERFSCHLVMISIAAAAAMAPSESETLSNELLPHCIRCCPIEISVPESWSVIQVGMMYSKDGS